MDTGHYADVVVMPLHLLHEVNARIVDAAHQAIRAGHEVGLAWPLAKDKSLGDWTRVFGSEKAIDAVRARLQSMADGQLLRVYPTKPTPPTEQYMRYCRDRASEKYCTPAALARRNRERVKAGLSPRQSLRESKPLPTLNMQSASTGYRFTIFLRVEACAKSDAPLGSAQYGLGMPLPSF